MNSRVGLLVFLVSITGCALDPNIPTRSGKVTGDELLQVPLRWCAVEGSSAVEDPAAVGENSTNDVLWRRHERASDNIWIPGARITFRSAMIAQVKSQANFPIIPDPNPPAGGGPGMEGDIEIVNLAFAPEINDVIADCEAAWDQLELQENANIEGIIVVNIRNFVAPSGGMSPVQGIQTFGTNLNCSEFSTLAQSVCLDPQNYPSNAGAAVVIRDNSTRLQFEPHENTLAHELGHALFLGHGNGLDDDGDNKVDECCDNDEDPDLPPESLMCPSCGSEVVTQHQRDFARQVALQTPGSVIDPPAVLKPSNVVSDQRVDTRHDTNDPGLDLVWMGMSENSATGVSLFTLKLFGLIPKNANYNYIVYVDLDDNPTTGAAPSDLGYQTTFKGVSLIIDVKVKASVKGIPIETQTVLYVARNSEWVKESGSASTFVGAAVEAETRNRLFDSINTMIKTGVIGVAGHQVAVRAEAIDRDSEQIDILPDKTEHTTLFMKPPEYSRCAVEPTQVKPGEVIVVEAVDLIPQQVAHVLLGDKLMAEAKIDEKGAARMQFRIPRETRVGIRLITVGAGKTAITADCAVEVVITK
ncbi:MAG: hypothetical protein OES38_01055 [Gammaproteobacteria bacterium]|nr:hypothetical protein [Gammaproteobacteria bacterium]